MRWKSCPAYTSLSQKAFPEAVLPFLSPLNVPGPASCSSLSSSWEDSSGQNHFSSLFASCVFPLQKRTRVLSLQKPRKLLRGVTYLFIKWIYTTWLQCFAFTQNVSFQLRLYSRPFLLGHQSGSFYSEPSFNSICRVSLPFTFLPNLAETGKYVLWHSHHRNDGERSKTGFWLKFWTTIASLIFTAKAGKV